MSGLERTPTSLHDQGMQSVVSWLIDFPTSMHLYFVPVQQQARQLLNPSYMRAYFYLCVLSQMREF